MNDINGIAVGLLVGGVVLLVAVLAVLLIGRLERSSKSPKFTMFLEALMPYAKEALYAAADVAERALKNGQTAIDGVDKKALADKFYAVLPDVISVGPLILPIGVVKAVVTQEHWEALVQRAFNEADARLTRNEEWLLRAAKILGEDSGAKTTYVVNVPAPVSEAK